MCNRRRSFQLAKGVAFWYCDGDGWFCGRCCDFDPKDPAVKSDKEGHTEWMGWPRDKPSRKPETHMQTWPEFCEVGIVVEEGKK